MPEAGTVKPPLLDHAQTQGAWPHRLDREASWFSAHCSHSAIAWLSVNKNIIAQPPSLSRLLHIRLALPVKECIIEESSRSTWHGSARSGSSATRVASGTLPSTVSRSRSSSCAPSLLRKSDMMIKHEPARAKDNLWSQASNESSALYNSMALAALLWQTSECRS